MKVAQTRTELLEALKEGRGTLSLVPTMGYLHEGHASLIREGKRRADRTAVTLFVNPTQFGPSEDLSRYPRDLPGDLATCRQAGADLVYAPVGPEEIYPPGFQTWVEVSEVSMGLCGASRPGHFRGVATVVTKLLSLFHPEVALFGEKDFQQLAVIRRLVKDLDLGVQVVGMPIVRDADGLALSSRNVYLSPQERARALSIPGGLAAAAAAFERGEREAAPLLEAARESLLEVDRLEYLELVDADTLRPVATVKDPACLLVAAFVGKTRLIDNRVLGR